MGLTTFLTSGKCGAVLISTSSRKGTADKLDGSIRFRRALCSILLSSISVRRTIIGASVGGLSVLPTSVSLTKTRVRVISVRGQRFLVGEGLSRMYSGCSFVLVSYPPSLNLVALGTLMTSRRVLVPVRTRFCTLRKLSRLIGAMRIIAHGLGPNLSVLKVLLAVFSNEAGLSLRMTSRIGGCFKGGIFHAMVPQSIGLSRTPDFNRPVLACTPGSGKTRTCGGLYHRIVGHIWSRGVKGEVKETTQREDSKEGRCQGCFRFPYYSR